MSINFRHQANSLPLVTRANIDVSIFNGRQTQYMPATEGIASCPEEFIPDGEWENHCLHSFSELRILLESEGEQVHSKDRNIVVPQLKSELAWNQFCFGCSNKLSLESRKLQLTNLIGIAAEDELETRIEDVGVATAISDAWTGRTKVPPTKKLLLQFDQVMTQRLLCYHISWLQNW